MAQKRLQDTPAPLFETSSQCLIEAPPWTATAAVVLRAMRVGRVWTSLLERVRVARGRAGVFVAIDYTLLLVLFALSPAPHLKALDATLGPVARVCTSLWERVRLPSRSALSRWLADLGSDHVSALAEVLLRDVIESGVDAARVGGLLDRDGQRTVVFDDDGTYHGARQRELADDATRPQARRRAAALTARGYYGGARRADVTRTRTALQQAHTQEWLGCWSAPGNGRPFEQLENACAAVIRDLASRDLRPAQGLLRLDGLYGYARIAAAIVRHGLGYLMRCADYRLLKRREVRAVLATPPHARYTSPDSPVVREVWQVLDLPWSAAADPTQKVTTRLLITRRAAVGSGKPNVGKRVGDGVYELFVTDRSPSGWSVQDVLSVYFARGGFEATLAQEDRERDLDRTLSWSPAGQSYWTLIGQLVWNVRIRLGLVLAPASPRVTLWADAHVEVPPTPITESGPLADDDPPSSAAPAEIPSAEVVPAPSEVPSAEVVPPPPAHAQGRISRAFGRSTGRFGGTDFVWTADGMLCCPNGSLLRQAERRREGQHLRLIYAASASDCSRCELSAQCRGRPKSKVHGRRVSVLFPLPTCATPSTGDSVMMPREPEAGSPPPPPSGSSPLPASTSKSAPRLGSRPVWWVDIAACRARRALREHLDGQRVVVGSVSLVGPSAPPFRTRDERAHRRQTWQQRFQRNQRPWDGTLVRVHGVPASLDEMLGKISEIQHAA
jgi:hypothetical protein